MRVLILLFLALPLLARELPPERAISSSLREAEFYERSGRPDLALGIIEGLLEAYPDQDRLRFQYAKSLGNMARYEEADSLLKLLAEEAPQSRAYLIERASLLLSAGREEEATGLLEGLYQTRKHYRDYQDIAEVWQRAGHYDKSRNTLQRGLQELPIGEEAGRGLLLVRLMEEELLSGKEEEILALLSEEESHFTSGGQWKFVLRKASELLLQSERSGDLLAPADSLSEIDKDGSLAAPLRQIYFRSGEWESYVREVLRSSFYPEGGSRARWIHREALRLKHRDAAAPLWEALVEEKNHSLSMEAQEQLLLMRLNLDRQQRLQGIPADRKSMDGILGEIRGLLEESQPLEGALSLVILEQELLRLRLGRVQEADARLSEERLRKKRPWNARTLPLLEEQEGLNLMALGELKEAREHWDRLSRIYSSRPNIAQLARFHSFELGAILDSASAARDSLAALAKEDPSSLLANDCLSRALFLAEIDSWPRALGELGLRSLSLELQAKPVEAAALLHSFCEEFPEEEPLPSLLLRIGDLQSLALRGEAARESWLRLSRDFPEDLRRPLALERAARISLDMGDGETASRILDQLLEEHPESLFRPSLRDLAEALEEWS